MPRHDLLRSQLVLAGGGAIVGATLLSPTAVGMERATEPLTPYWG